LTERKWRQHATYNNNVVERNLGEHLVGSPKGATFLVQPLLTKWAYGQQACPAWSG
jgi:hypothetical protein